MTTEDFLSRLDHVTPTKRGWQARCPAHADKNPSLSIREGEEGRIVLHDFAGCAPSEICAAVGLTVADLFADHGRSRKDIRRDKAEREAKRARKEKEFKETGARLDAVREAERLIRCARNIDTSDWSDATMDAALNRLADSYDLLATEEDGDGRARMF